MSPTATTRREEPSTRRNLARLPQSTMVGDIGSPIAGLGEV